MTPIHNEKHESIRYRQEGGDRGRSEVVNVTPRVTGHVLMILRGVAVSPRTLLDESGEERERLGYPDASHSLEWSHTVKLRRAVLPWLDERP